MVRRGWSFGTCSSRSTNASIVTCGSHRPTTSTIVFPQPDSSGGCARQQDVHAALSTRSGHQGDSIPNARAQPCGLGRGLEGAQLAPAGRGAGLKGPEAPRPSAEGEGTTTQGPTESQGRQKQPTREETGLLAAANRGCPGVGGRATCRGPVTGRAREVGPAHKRRTPGPAWPGLWAEERLGVEREREKMRRILYKGVISLGRPVSPREGAP